MINYLGLCSTDEKIRTVSGYSGGNIIINYKYETLEENPVIYSEGKNDLIPC